MAKKRMLPLQSFIKKCIANPYISLAIIVLFALALRLIFFTGMGYSDDLHYAGYAQDPFDIKPDTLSVRIGMVFLTALSERTLGATEMGVIAPILFFSLLSIVLAFLFGRLLFDTRSGLFSALVLAIFPLDIFYSTKLMTDVPSAFLMSLGVYLFLRAEIRGLHAMHYALSGMCIGLGYLVRESTLLIALFFMAYIAWKRKITLNYFFVPLGVLFIFGCEAAFFFHATGDPLYRWVVPQQYLEEFVKANNYYGRLDFPSGLLHYPYLFLTDGLILFHFLFVALAIAYALLRRDKGDMTMILWLAAVATYLSFGSSSLTSYIPFVGMDRYLTLITMPSVLLLGHFLANREDSIRRAIAPAIVALLLITSIGTLALREEKGTMDNLKAVYVAVSASNATVFTDERTVRALAFLSEYSNEIDAQQFPPSLPSGKDYYVLVNERTLGLKNGLSGKVPEVPKDVLSAPASWIVVASFGEEGERAILYRKTR